MEYLRADASDIALATAESFSDKKQVWVQDQESGFCKATVIKDNGDTLLVEKVTKHEVMTCVLNKIEASEYYSDQWGIY